jgi:putative hemolysin
MVYVVRLYPIHKQFPKEIFMNKKVKSVPFNPLVHSGNTAVASMKVSQRMGVTVLLLVAFMFTACSGGADGESAASSNGSAAADYCRESGGEVESRYPFYGTNQANPLQLSGSLEVCRFTADDNSHILISLDTLYTDQPTLAALAYRAQTPVEGGGAPSANPSSLYCTQLGGTDTFGGINAAGGGWALADASDVISLCVFPDLSVIDSWGITYHAGDVIRGADLNDLLRYTE